MSNAVQKVSRADAVLLLVDMQDRLVAAMPRREQVLATAALLARAAGVLGIPTIVTRQYRRGLGDTAPELLGALRQHFALVDKSSFSCCDEPTFLAELEATGRRQVVITGMETHICITQTVLDLLSEGYSVHVVADAVCSRRDSDRDIALQRLRGAGAIVTVAESAIYEALGAADATEFRVILDLVKAHPLA